MATKNLKLEEATAKRLYKTADADFKTMLEETFGKEFFSQKITDRIKTWQDVLDQLGVDEDDIVPFRSPKTKEQRSLNAIAKIQKISEVLNEGWTPDFTYGNNQYKYYPYFYKKDGASGWSVHSSHAVCGFSVVGFGFYYKTSDLAMYAGQQFLAIYKEYLP